MSFPNLSFWSNLLGATGIEVGVVVALGIAAQAAFRRAWWKRAMWQMTLLCLILISCFGMDGPQVAARCGRSSARSTQSVRRCH